MSAKDLSSYATETDGKAKYIRVYSNSANDTGLTFDFAGIVFEAKTGTTDYIKIWNRGSKTVYVAFDTDHSTIDINDPSTYNFPIYSTTPYSEISMNSEADKIAFKCASGETTALIVMVH